MDLGFDSTDGRTEAAKGGGGLVGGAGNVASQDRHASRPEELFGLKFVNFHDWILW
jgi:hypothetical protein